MCLNTSEQILRLNNLSLFQILERLRADNYYNQDCAATYPRDNPFKAWKDAQCNDHMKWICEKEPHHMSNVTFSKFNLSVIVWKNN